MARITRIVDWLAGLDDEDLKSWRPNDHDFPTMSDTEALIVQALIARGKSYGLDLVRTSEGRLKSGTVYITLQRMEDKGFITACEEASEEPHKLPRRVYEVTGVGARVFKTRVAHARALTWAWGGAS